MKIHDCSANGHTPKKRSTGTVTLARNRVYINADAGVHMKIGVRKKVVYGEEDGELYIGLTKTSNPSYRGWKITLNKDANGGLTNIDSKLLEAYPSGKYGVGEKAREQAGIKLYKLTKV